MSVDFWQTLDKLVAESKIVIDRFKDSQHPKYPDLIYPLDYGYLEDTTAMDGGGIDIWIGSDGDDVDAIICTVDLIKIAYHSEDMLDSLKHQKVMWRCVIGLTSTTYSRNFIKLILQESEKTYENKS